MAMSTARPSACSMPVEAPPPPAKLSTMRPAGGGEVLGGDASEDGAEDAGAAVALA
jgi:hypothetical protein